MDLTLYIRGMENNLKAKVYTAVDLGMTEDEWDNMLIDMHVEAKKVRPPAYQSVVMATGEIIEGPIPRAITITFPK